MKNLILFIAITFCTYSFGQKYVVTPKGLRNSTDTAKSFVTIEIIGMDAFQLYDSAIKYFSENYKNPNEAIKARTIGEYLKIETIVPDFIKYYDAGVYVPIEAKYTTELRFKDGKVRYEITSLEMKGISNGYPVIFAGGVLDGYIIYRNNGKLFREEAKLDIENFFNTKIEKLTKGLKGENKIVVEEW